VLAYFLALGGLATARALDASDSDLAIDRLDIVEANESVVVDPLARGSRAYLLVEVTGMRPNPDGRVEVTGDLELIAPDGKIDRRIGKLMAYQGPLRPFERDNMRLEMDRASREPPRLVFRPSFTLPDPVATTSFIVQVTVHQGSEQVEANKTVVVAGVAGLKTQGGTLKVEGIRIANTTDPAAPGGQRFNRKDPLYLHVSVQGFRTAADGTVRLGLDGRLILPSGRSAERQRWATFQQPLARVGLPLTLQVRLPITPDMEPGPYQVELWISDLVAGTKVHQSAGLRLE
jgi:hypothetical protein